MEIVYSIAAVYFFMGLAVGLLSQLVKNTEVKTSILLIVFWPALFAMFFMDEKKLKSRFGGMK